MTKINPAVYFFIALEKRLYCLISLISFPSKKMLKRGHTLFVIIRLKMLKTSI